MTYHTLEFRLLQWPTPEQLRTRLALAAAGSLLWGILYSWLGYRLWFTPSAIFASRFNFGLATLSILLGVALVIEWRKLWQLWSARTKSQRWHAMTLEEMQDLSPSDFEEYVAEWIFARRGYQVINTPDAKDGGVDVLVTDEYGYKAVVQCKRYRGTVGEPTVRDLYGAMFHENAQRAYLVTTGRITESAQRWAMGKPIGLVDGERLVELAKTDLFALPSL